MQDQVGKQAGVRPCPACYRQHLTQAWRCAACERDFICDSQFITALTIGGASIRAHIRSGVGDGLGDACGPIGAMVAVETMTALARAKERAGVA